MKTPELKPCPFCGGEADYKDDGQYGYAYCTCCLARTDERYSWRDPEWKREVASEWNTRVYPKDVQEAIDKNKPRPPVIHPLAWLPRWEFPHCPQCDVQVKEYLKHCWNCGQKLDWSENNEVDKEATR